ncbi:MAG TPA: META domain-containing protein [Burkholderiaceae bacterium]|nr:META domain-containing protein [Burkholderiaceae bacterium]
MAAVLIVVLVLVGAWAMHESAPPPRPPLPSAAMDGATPAGAAGARAERAPAALLGVRWRLVELDGKPVAAPTGAAMAPTAADGEPPWLGLAPGSQLIVFGGCNRIGGTYQLDERALRFDRLRSTRRACAPPTMQLETELLAALPQVNDWRLSGDRLELLDAAGRPRLRFESAGPLAL